MDFTTELDNLNDQRDQLITEIADYKDKIEDLEAELDISQVALHNVDLQIKKLNATTGKATPGMTHFDESHF